MIKTLSLITLLFITPTANASWHHVMKCMQSEPDIIDRFYGFAKVGSEYCLIDLTHHGETIGTWEENKKNCVQPTTNRNGDFTLLFKFKMEEYYFYTLFNLDQQLERGMVRVMDRAPRDVSIPIKLGADYSDEITCTRTKMWFKN